MCTCTNQLNDIHDLCLRLLGVLPTCFAVSANLHLSSGTTPTLREITLLILVNGESLLSCRLLNDFLPYMEAVSRWFTAVLGQWRVALNAQLAAVSCLLQDLLKVEGGWERVYTDLYTRTDGCDLVRTHLCMSHITLQSAAYMYVYYKRIRKYKAFFL